MLNKRYSTSEIAVFDKSTVILNSRSRHHLLKCCDTSHLVIITMFSNPIIPPS